MAAFYVDSTGNDTAAGGIADPVRTIAKGKTLLSAGDTLFIRGGVYEEEITNFTSETTLSAYQDEEVIVRPPPGSNRVITFAGADNCIIRNLRLDGQNVELESVKVTFGTVTGPSRHIVIEGCEIYNGPRTAIYTRGDETLNVRRCLIDRCKIHSNGTDDHDHGIYLSTPENTVRDCQISHNSGWGVVVWSNSSTVEQVSDNIVERCWIYSNGVSGKGSGIGCYQGLQLQCIDNRIQGESHDYGIDVRYGAEAYLRGNSVSGRQPYRIETGTTVSGDIIVTPP